MIPKKLLQVNRDGVRIFGTPEEFSRARHFFDRHHFIRLAQFLSPELLKGLHEKIRAGVFFKKIHKDIATELCLREKDATHTLRFITNDRTLFGWIETLTGCAKIGCFTGRVYRMQGKAHHDDWHNDMTENRMIAMSVNLSEKVYRGGHLILRRRGDSGTERVIPNTGYGDAVLFRLSYELEHRVMDIEGAFPKTAYAGWFREKPDFFKTVKNLRKKKKKKPRILHV